MVSKQTSDWVNAGMRAEAMPEWLKLITEQNNRYRELQLKLESNSGRLSPDLMRELSQLQSKMEFASTVEQTLRQLTETNEMLQQERSKAVKAEQDTELIQLIEQERLELAENLAKLDQQHQVLRQQESAVAIRERPLILEIRAGAGGDEAALFAGVLWRMYLRFCELQNWKFEVLSFAETDLDGCKEGIATIFGKGCFAKLRFESGVHRVQRIPQTEAGGRIHTSTASVIILPEPDDISITINPADLRIDTYRAQGAGGQHVNKTDSAVRITHLPSGLVVQCQDDKSQHRNRDRAMKILKARLADLQQREEMAERSRQRRSLVNTGDRSERIRTYNFPQNRVSDHRINTSWHKLEKILDGSGLDEVLEAVGQKLATIE